MSKSKNTANGIFRFERTPQFKALYERFLADPRIVAAPQRGVLAALKSWIDNILMGRNEIQSLSEIAMIKARDSHWQETKRKVVELYNAETSTKHVTTRSEFKELCKLLKLDPSKILKESPLSVAMCATRESLKLWGKNKRAPMFAELLANYMCDLNLSREQKTRSLQDDLKAARDTRVRLTVGEQLMEKYNHSLAKTVLTSRNTSLLTIEQRNAIRAKYVEEEEKITREKVAQRAALRDAWADLSEDTVDEQGIVWSGTAKYSMISEEEYKSRLRRATPIVVTPDTWSTVSMREAFMASSKKFRSSILQTLSEPVAEVGVSITNSVIQVCAKMLVCVDVLQKPIEDFISNLSLDSCMNLLSRVVMLLAAAGYVDVKVTIELGKSMYQVLTDMISHLKRQLYSEKQDFINPDTVVELPPIEEEDLIATAEPDMDVSDRDVQECLLEGAASGVFDPKTTAAVLKELRQERLSDLKQATEISLEELAVAYGDVESVDEEGSQEETKQDCEGSYTSLKDVEAVLKKISQSELVEKLNSVIVLTLLPLSQFMGEKYNAKVMAWFIGLKTLFSGPTLVEQGVGLMNVLINQVFPAIVKRDISYLSPATISGRSEAIGGVIYCSTRGFHDVRAMSQAAKDFKGRELFKPTAPLNVARGLMVSVVDDMILWMKSIKPKIESIQINLIIELMNAKELLFQLQKGNRSVPLCCGITGSPAFGKSSLANKIPNSILSLFGLSADHLTPEGEWVFSPPTKLEPTCKFQDNASPNDMAFVINDIPTIPLKPGTMDGNVYAFIMGLVDTIDFYLNKSNVNEKKFNAVRNLLVILTSNVRDYGCEKQVVSKEAFLRRIHFTADIRWTSETDHSHYTMDVNVIDLLANNTAPHLYFSRQYNLQNGDSVFSWQADYLRMLQKFTVENYIPWIKRNEAMKIASICKVCMCHPCVCENPELMAQVERVHGPLCQQCMQRPCACSDPTPEQILSDYKSTEVLSAIQQSIPSSACWLAEWVKQGNTLSTQIIRLLLAVTVEELISCVFSDPIVQFSVRFGMEFLLSGFALVPNLANVFLMIILVSICLQAGMPTVFVFHLLYDFVTVIMKEFNFGPIISKLFVDVVMSEGVGSTIDLKLEANIKRALCSEQFHRKLADTSLQVFEDPEFQDTMVETASHLIADEENQMHLVRVAKRIIISPQVQSMYQNTRQEFVDRVRRDLAEAYSRTLPKALALVAGGGIMISALATLLTHYRKPRYTSLEIPASEADKQATQKIETLIDGSVEGPTTGILSVKESPWKAINHLKFERTKQNPERWAANDLLNVELRANGKCFRGIRMYSGICTVKHPFVLGVNEIEVSDSRGKTKITIDLPKDVNSLVFLSTKNTDLMWIRHTPIDHSYAPRVSSVVPAEGDTVLYRKKEYLVRYSNVKVNLPDEGLCSGHQTVFVIKTDLEADGWSGSPVFLVEHKGARIKPVMIGMQSAICRPFGNSDLHIGFVTIPSEIMEWMNVDAKMVCTTEGYFSALQEAGEIVDMDPHNVFSNFSLAQLDHVDSKPIGSLKPATLVRNVESNFHETEYKILLEQIFPEMVGEYAIPYLRNRKMDNAYCSSMYAGLGQLLSAGKVLHSSPVVRCSDKVALDFISLIGEDVHKLYIGNTRYVIKGNRFTAPLNLSSSSGCVTAIKTGVTVNSGMVCGSHEQPYYTAAAAALVQQMLDSLAKGEPIYQFGRACLKDEVVSKKKNDDFLVRVFVSGEFPFLAVCKMFLGPLFEIIQSKRGILPIQVGIDSLSHEFYDMYRKMYFSLYPNGTEEHMHADTIWLDHDFSKYDKRNALIPWGLTVLKKTFSASKFYQDRPDKLLMVHTLLDSLTTYALGVDGFYVHMTTGQPSGVYTTTMVNSICTWIYERLLFHFCCFAKKFGRTPTSEDFVLMTEEFIFEDHVRMAIFGDDIFKCLSQWAKTLYTHDLIVAFSHSIHMKMTPSNKKATQMQPDLLSKGKFLQRELRKVGDYWIGQLVKPSIIRSLSYSSAKKQDFEQTKEAARREASYHEQEFRDKLAPVLGYYDAQMYVESSYKGEWSLTPQADCTIREFEGYYSSKEEDGPSNEEMGLDFSLDEMDYRFLEEAFDLTPDGLSDEEGEVAVFLGLTNEHSLHIWETGNSIVLLGRRIHAQMTGMCFFRQLVWSRFEPTALEKFTYGTIRCIESSSVLIRALEKLGYKGKLEDFYFVVACCIESGLDRYIRDCVIKLVPLLLHELKDILKGAQANKRLILACANTRYNLGMVLESSSNTYKITLAHINHSVCYREPTLQESKDKALSATVQFLLEHIDGFIDFVYEVYLLTVETTHAGGIENGPVTIN